MSSESRISPSLAYAAGGVLIGTFAGFVLGRSTAPTPKRPSKHIKLVDSEDEEDLDEEDEQEGLNGFANSYEECKLVLVVRTDLGMTKGKLDPIFYPQIRG
jgi:PTH2 family peptidyl-tRNA hydrolase